MRLVVRRGESEAREHGVEQCGSVVLRQQGLFPWARSGRGLVSEPHRAGARPLETRQLPSASWVRASCTWGEQERHERQQDRH